MRPHAGGRSRGPLQGPFQLTNNDDVSLERIREYLGRLTSQARSNLLVEIERIQLYGDDVPGSETILTQLRAEFRKSGQSHDRAGSPSRHFFKPIEGLFVDRPPERANSGEISRGSRSARRCHPAWTNLTASRLRRREAFWISSPPSIPKQCPLR